MSKPDAAATAAYDAAADEYDRIHLLVIAHKPGRARDAARTQLTMSAKFFRLASLTAPAEGETSESFDRQIANVNKLLASALELLDGGS